MGLIDSHPETYLPRDSASGNFLTIDAEHGAVHDGVHFTATHVVTVGTVLETHIIGTDGNPSAQTGGGASHNQEWVLGTGTNYLIRFVADSADTDVSVLLPYYYRT